MTQLPSGAAGDNHSAFTRAPLRQLLLDEFSEIEAATRSNIQAFGNYLKQQQFFLEDHLGAWVSDFVKNMIANSDTEFYKALAKSTNIFVKQDLQLVRKYNNSKNLNDNMQLLAGT